MSIERQKMLAGDLYNPLDAELVAARERARDLCRELNDTRECEHAQRRRILQDLFGTGGGEHLAQGTNTPFLGKIPIDQNVRIGGDTGKPIVTSHPNSPVAVALREIAGNIAAKVSVAALGSKNDLPINIVE